MEAFLISAWCLRIPECPLIPRRSAPPCLVESADSFHLDTKKIQWQCPRKDIDKLTGLPESSWTNKSPTFIDIVVIGLVLLRHTMAWSPRDVPALPHWSRFYCQNRRKFKESLILLLAQTLMTIM